MEPSENTGVRGDVSQRSAEKLAHRFLGLMQGAFGTSTDASDMCDSDKPKGPQLIETVRINQDRTTRSPSAYFHGLHLFECGQSCFMLLC